MSKLIFMSQTEPTTRMNNTKDDKYLDYFKNHYRVSFNERDIFTYAQWFQAQLDLIKRVVVLSDHGTSLELGAAFGGFYQFLTASQKKGYTGLDLDDDIVQFSNEYWKTNCFIKIPFEKYTAEIGSTDHIFAFEVLEHLDNPFECILKMKSLLRTGGSFIGTSPFPFVKNIYADKTHRYVLHPKNWQKLFIDAGFTEVTTYPMSFVPYLWRINRKLNVRLPFYVPFKHVISTTLIVARA